jgi:hypothetical protein
MDKLLNLALFILADVIPSEHRRANTRRATTAAVCAALAAIALLAGVGFGIAALWIWLETLYNPLSAALICMAALLVISGVLILVARGQFREEQRASARSTLGDDLARELRYLFLRHKGSALLTALIAGLATGRGK